jgi:spore maturation protein CgeB
MSGGLYLTQDNPELSLVYDIGKEIITYTDAGDCINKIKWLLANPDEAEKIRKSGKLSATSKHRWEDRFSEVFQLIGLLR